VSARLLIVSCSGRQYQSSILFEGVYELDAFDNLVMLEIFRVDCVDHRLFRGCPDHGIPIGEIMNFPTSDRFEHYGHLVDDYRPDMGEILNDGFGFVRADERTSRTCCTHEEFGQDLNADYAGSIFPAALDKLPAYTASSPSPRRQFYTLCPCSRRYPDTWN